MKAKKALLVCFFLFLCCRINADNNFVYLWSTYTTYFRQDIDDRAINIRIATHYLDGQVLMPKAIFSFNDDITSRIPEDHLGVASVLIAEEKVPGYGGGLCQVSSTLYAACLLAGLSIHERKAHSKMVSYITPGLDATVSKDEGVDLKIYNPFGCKLMIKATVKDNSLTVSIYGSKPKQREIRILTTKPQKIGNFIHITTIREVVSSGNVAFSEVVSRDRYLVSE